MRHIHVVRVYVSLKARLAHSGIKSELYESYNITRDLSDMQGCFSIAWKFFFYREIHACKEGFGPIESINYNFSAGPAMLSSIVDVIVTDRSYRPIHLHICCRE